MWYFCGLLLVVTTNRTYGSFEETPVQYVMIICTMFICGAILGVKEKNG
jgi:hypothetical protein